MSLTEGVNFTGDAVTTTVRHLRRLRNENTLVNKALEKEGTLSSETTSLFYFFEKIKPYNIPKLEAGHDTRLGELEEVLNGMNLATYAGDSKYASTGRELDGKFRSLLERGIKLPRTYPGHEFREAYEYLRGDKQIDVTELRSEPLMPCVDGMYGKLAKGQRRTMVGFVVASFGLFADHQLISLADFMIGNLLFFNGAANLRRGMRMRPSAYDWLTLKAKVGDEFIDQYRDILL